MVRTEGETAAGKATKARDFCSDDVKNWTEIITKGKNKMPSYNQKITDAEIKELIAYMRGLCE